MLEVFGTSTNSTVAWKLHRRIFKIWDIFDRFFSIFPKNFLTFSSDAIVKHDIVNFSSDNSKIYIGVILIDSEVAYLS